MDLAKIIIPSKESAMEYPGFPGLEFNVAYLTRDELVKLRKKATQQKLNRKTRQMEDEVDSDLFQDMYINAVIKGWSGFKYNYLERMIPVDTSGIPDNEYCGVIDEEGTLGDPGDGEFEFSPSNAVAFMKNCSDFDNWLTGQLEDVENFTQNS